MIEGCLSKAQAAGGGKMGDTNEVLVINGALTIPLSELSFRFSTSSGPGGQHANRAETRVTVLFDIAQSPSLTETQRQRLLQRLASRLDSGGNLAVTVQESRSQHQNRELALARLQQLLAEALRPGKKPRRKTRPTLASRERRLQAKRQRSEIKQARRWRWP